MYLLSTWGSEESVGFLFFFVQILSFWSDCREKICLQTPGNTWHVSQWIPPSAHPSSYTWLYKKKKLVVHTVINWLSDRGSWSIDWSIGQSKSWLNWFVANEIPLRTSVQWRWPWLGTQGECSLKLQKSTVQQIIQRMCWSAWITSCNKIIFFFFK